MIDHMDIESICVHKDSEEAQNQLSLDANATGNFYFIWYSNIIFVNGEKSPSGTSEGTIKIAWYYRTKSGCPKDGKE